MATYCLECGDKIIGRIDKKFCNDGCRNSYNNKHNRDSSNLMRKINRRLRMNFKTLNELDFVEGKVKIHQDKLRKENFDFDYFTHLKTYKNGSEYRFIYNIGYKVLDDGWLLIVKNEAD